MAGVEQNLEANVQQAGKLLNTVIDFAVTYGFQILGALVFLFIGLKLAAWLARRVQRMAALRGMDVTLARFMGSFVKIVVVTLLAIITLGNFGISIAPLIALAGASAFGATMAIQGPLSNYGAGLSIIMGRPFKVGDTISVAHASGVVTEVKMAYTQLLGEDGECITIPNKDVVGRVIVNSGARRVVETKVALDPDADLEKAKVVAAAAVAKVLAEDQEAPPAQVGLHDFTYGGMILGVRFWVRSSQYFDRRYAVNSAVLAALREAGVALLKGVQPAVLAEKLSGDGVQEGHTESGGMAGSDHKSGA